MGYESKRPTKEKKNLYSFMERHKHSGVVSARRLDDYAERKGFKFHYTNHRGYYWIANKRGTSIGGVLVRKKRVNHWVIN